MDPNSHRTEDEKLNKAATKIQSTYRGYKTRSQIKKTTSTSSNKPTTTTTSHSKTGSSKTKHSDVANKKVNQEEQAAIKIQSTFRGYKTRKQLDSIKSNRATS